MAALPDDASLEWLRKSAKKRLVQLRQDDPSARLSDAQFAIAKEYGFSSWRALKAQIDSMTVDGQLEAAAREGDAATLGALLDAHPDKLHLKAKPYGASLLHLGASHLAVVDLLVERGLDPNLREGGDNTYPMHWAAAAGALDAVRRLADAGGDVIGAGDDHQMEVIGWASCWDGCDDAAHQAVREFLISRGARHHIFSAVAIGDEAEVRRVVGADPAALASRQSRNENNRTPLQLAVAMNRREMVTLLLELGADPLGVDGWGMPAAAYAETPEIDRPIMERIHSLGVSEIVSANRGSRRTTAAPMDLLASVTLGDWTAASRMIDDTPSLLDGRGGVLHLLAKRGDARGLRWLLDRGADPDGRWAHFDSEVTPLHLAILANHADAATLLLSAGADTTIRDTKHDADALGWAEFFNRAEIVEGITRLRSR